jgi:probable HAF family extracellular repeat protein
MLTILLGFSPAALASDYTFTPIDVPGAWGGTTTATGINDFGNIVGNYFDGTLTHGFLYVNGNFTSIGVPGTFTAPYGINNSGEIVGYTGNQRGFLYVNGNFTSISVPGSTATQAYGINNFGNIVGFYQDALGSHGFLYVNGNFTSIDALINIVGYYVSSASGINDLGDIVGTYSDATGGHAFLYKNGNFTSIDVPGATGTWPTGINNFGNIVGYYADTANQEHGFLYANGKFTLINVPGSPYTNAFGINDSGQIVGGYNDATAHHGFLATPVAQPVPIDIKPGDDINSINLKSKGKIPVAILSTENFDALSQIILTSLTFGRTGDEQSLAFCRGSEDVNKDGLQDLVCHFYTQYTGFQYGDTVGILRGNTKDGTLIEGSDSVKIMPCK